MRNVFHITAATAALGMMLLSFPAGAFAGERVYHNDRYGFTAVWPDDAWEERESANGDGIAVFSGDGLEIRTWGAMDIGNPGMTFDAFSAQMRGMIEKVTRQKAARSRREVRLSGASQGRSVFLRAFQSADSYAVMMVSCPSADAAARGAEVDRILAGFAPASEQGAAPQDVMEEPVVEAAFVSGLMERFPSGRNVFVAPDGSQGGIFLLRALEPVEVSFHAAVFDERTGKVLPGKKLGGFPLKAGGFGCFRYTVPEGMPTLVVKAGPHEWTPMLSGEDGSLVGARGIRAVPAEPLAREAAGAFPAAAHAAMEPIPMLITDRDPAGTNLRMAPAGEIAAVVPFGGMREVSAAEERNGWFRIRSVKGSAADGWMHGNVLGLCAQATDAGMPVVYPEPMIEPDKGVRISEDTALRPLRRSGNFLKVRYRDAQGRGREGWMTVFSVTAQPMSLPHCAEKLGAD